MNKFTFLNNSLTRGLSKLICAAAIVGAFSSTALAGPISGEIGYGGKVTPEDGSGTEVSLGTADFLDFDPGGFVSPGLATGDFSPLNGTAVALSDFFIDPFSSPSLVWTGGGFSFTLTSLSIDTQTDSPYGQLALSGFGIFEHSSYDDTIGFWTLTANDSGGDNVVFSATTTVPEPGTLVIFGLGLLSLGLIRRPRLAAKAS